MYVILLLIFSMTNLNNPCSYKTSNGEMILKQFSYFLTVNDV